MNPLLNVGPVLLSGVGFLRSKEHIRCTSLCVFLDGLWPRFRQEATKRKAAVIDQRHQDGDLPLAKDTDQAQLGGPPRLGGWKLVGRQRQKGALGNRLLRHPPDTE
jgi:hypothetical protein